MLQNNLNKKEFKIGKKEIKENTIIYLKLKNQGYIYECYGVYINETEEKLELAFNALDDKVLDSVHFNKLDILEMAELGTDLKVL